MKKQDKFSEQYMDYLDGTYGSVDRIVLNAYFRIGQSPGGFRFWWRMLMGNDDTLNNSQRMRFQVDSAEGFMHMHKNMEHL